MFHTAPKEMTQNAKAIEWPEGLTRLFDGAADKPWGETGRALTDDQIVLLNESGNRLQDERVFSASNQYDPKAQKEVKEKKQRDMARYASGSILNITVDEAIDRLSDYSARLQSIANVGSDYFLRPIDDGDLLRIKDGRIISAAEDPDGDYIVRTAEAKADFERENGICVGGLTLDEITLNENGDRVSAKEFLIQEQMQDRIETIDQAVKDLEAGRVTVDELPEDLQKIMLGEDDGLIPPIPDENLPIAQTPVFVEPSVRAPAAQPVLAFS